MRLQSAGDVCAEANGHLPSPYTNVGQALSRDAAVMLERPARNRGPDAHPTSEAVCRASSALLRFSTVLSIRRALCRARDRDLAASVLRACEYADSFCAG